MRHSSQPRGWLGRGGLLGAGLGWWTLGAIIWAGAQTGTARADVLTQRYDQGRTGLAIDATLTPSSVSDGKFQKLAELPVDGAVYAQPLYVENLSIPSVGVRDVVYIATARNKLYAFDADSFQKLWEITSLPGPDLSDMSLSAPCALLGPTHVGEGLDVEFGIGIQSTPVIDRAAGSHGYLYFTYRTASGQDATSAQQFIGRADLATGQLTTANLSNALTDTGVPVSGLRQRTSLLLEDGVIYAAFGSHCEELAVDTQDPAFDIYKYRGMILAVAQSTLAPIGKFETLPAANTWGGGIWMASSGLASDGEAIFFTTGNALPNATVMPGLTSVSSSFVKLASIVDLQAGTATMSVVDFFTPFRALWQDTIDLDLGSAGVLIPPGSGRVISGGKEGILYVLDRADLGGFDASHWSWSGGGTPIPGCATPPDENALCDDSPSNPNPCYAQYPDSQNAESGVAQKFVGARNMDCAAPSLKNWIGWPHFHGTPTFGNVGGTEYLYVWPEKGQFRAHERMPSGGDLKLEPTPHLGHATTPNAGMPGGMLTLSQPAVGASGVVFAALPLEAYIATLRGALVAFDATPQPDGTLKQLWGDYNEVYYHSKFVPPTVADGKVFLATFSDKIQVYGRVAQAPAVSARAGLAATLHNRSSHSVTAATVQSDGRIAIFGENNDGPWHAISVLGSAGEFPIGAPVAMGRQGSQLDVFAVGNDGKVHLYWTLQTSNPTTWYPSTTSPGVLSASTNLPPGANLATLQRGSNELDVFGVDDDGDLRIFAVIGSGGWASEKVLPGSSPKFPPGGAVSADIQKSFFSSRAAVFAVDNSGALAVFNANNSAGSHNWTRTAVSNTDLVPGAQLATGHQLGVFTDVLDVFAIGGQLGELVDPDTPDSGVSNSYNSDLDNDGALMVIRAAGYDPWSVHSLKRKGSAPGVPGGHVTAINQGSGQLDVFFAAQDGGVQIYWVSGTGHGWFNSEVFMHAMPGAPIQAVAQTLSGGYPGQIDVLVPGKDHVWGAFLFLGLWTEPFVAL